jgi:hypothetical protein
MRQAYHARDMCWGTNLLTWARPRQKDRPWLQEETITRYAKMAEQMRRRAVYDVARNMRLTREQMTKNGQLPQDIRDFKMDDIILVSEWDPCRGRKFNGSCFKGHPAFRFKGLGKIVEVDRHGVHFRVQWLTTPSVGGARIGDISRNKFHRR